MRSIYILHKISYTIKDKHPSQNKHYIYSQYIYNRAFLYSAPNKPLHLRLQPKRLQTWFSIYSFSSFANFYVIIVFHWYLRSCKSPVCTSSVVFLEAVLNFSKKFFLAWCIRFRVCFGWFFGPLRGMKMCILYMPRSRDDVHIVSTKAVRNVQENAQIHTAHGIISK